MSEPLDLVALAKSGDSDAVREQLRELCQKSLFFFTKAVLGYNLLTPHLHQHLCHWIVDTREMGGRGILMPRGSYKSTIAKSYALWRLKDNPNMRILFVGESDTVAAKSLNDIRWHLTQNKLFAWLYPDIIPPDIGQTKWTSTEVLLPRSQSFDESTITTAGVGAKLTGFHYDLIVYDDIIGLVASQSPAEMHAAIEWFRTAPGLLNDINTAEEIIVGTRWKDGTADLYGWAMERLPFKKTKATREGFTWYIRKAIEEEKPIFPEKYSLAVLAAIRRREGDYHFNAQYMNDPTAPEGADFKPDWIRNWRRHEADPQVAVLDDGEEVHIKKMVRVTMYDPSAGGRAASAENAIVVVGMDYKRRIIVIDTWSKNCGFGEAIEQWHVLNDRWAPWRNFYEAVGAHKEVEEIERMRPQVCLYCKQVHKRKLVPRPIRPGGGTKEDRIRDLAQQAFEERRVYLRDGMEKLRRQITTFPHSAMVDQFDALAYAIAELRAPSSYEENEDTRLGLDPRRASQPRTQTGIDYGGYS